MVPGECTSRSNLFRTGDPDRAGVIHDVAGIGHVQAGRDKKQQNRGDNDGEQNAIQAALPPI
jgi:hypothetical protein